MFDAETLNAFAGGYKVSAAGVITIAGSPEFSNVNYSISIPVSLSLSALTKADSMVRWRGTNVVNIPYEISRTSNDWFDPIKIMMNISIQRGWTSPPSILANEDLKFHMGMGYYSAFVDVLIQSFSLVNNVNLSAAEAIELSSEVQEMARGFHTAIETLTRINGKDENVFIYDKRSKTFKNEHLKLEPYSLLAISENYLEENENYQSFKKNFNRFLSLGMASQNPSSLSYPFLNFHNHLSAEEEMVNKITNALMKDDSQEFASSVSKYSQSLGFNLGVVSNFQRIVASLLERYSINDYLFAVNEYSGSVIVFSDSLGQKKISENLVRDYYNITNRTLSVREISNKNTTGKDRIVV
ncbi:MAG: hypothetical protein QXN66_03490 [Thermoplasmatales archaeon]